MKLKDAYREILIALRKIYDEKESSSIARLVFEDLGYLHLDIHTRPEFQLPKKILLKLNRIRAKLQQEIPVQYVLGYAWFNERKFRITPSCLIPRQETEQMVDIIIRDNQKLQHILDLGTGSGCIAVSLKLAFPRSHVTATDKYPAAIEIAKENAGVYNTEITFLEDDLLNQTKSGLTGTYDLIVSNPPYVRESEKALMSRIVYSNEPAEALFVKDTDPLVFYRAIRDICDSKLLPGGRVYLEVNEAFAEETRNVFSTGVMGKSEIIKDIHGKKRFIKAIRNE